jgi:transposase
VIASAVRAKRHSESAARLGAGKAGYNFSAEKSDNVYAFAQTRIYVLPKSEETKGLVTLAAEQLNAIMGTLAALQREMLRLAAALPEFEVVTAMRGVGDTLGPQLTAEIGDVRRFTHKGALAAFAGLDAPPYQSGSFDSQSRHISKRGSPPRRR